MVNSHIKGRGGDRFFMRGDDASGIHSDEGKMLEIRHAIVFVKEKLCELGLYFREIVKIGFFCILFW